MFEEVLLKKLPRSLDLVLMYGNKIKSRDCEDEHKREEANNLISH